MYLIHILILVPVSASVRGWLGSGNDGLLGIWTTPVEILLSAVTTFAAVAIVSLILQKIPKIGKYIIG